MREAQRTGPPKSGQWASSVPNESSRNWIVLLLSQHRRCTWLKWVPFQVVATIIGFCVFGGGWIYSQSFSFGPSYQSTRAVWTLCFTISWVLASVYWGLLQIPERIADLDSCFAESFFNDQDYKSWAQKWSKWFASNPWMLGCGLAILAWGVEVVYSGMFGWFPQSLSDAIKPRSHSLPDYWFTSPLVNRFVLVLWLGGGAALAGGAGLWLFVLNVAFLWRVSKLQVISIPNVLVTKFRLMTDFYLYSTGAWFVGVALVVALFFRNFSGTAQVIVTVSSLIGLTAFMGPQWVFHRLIVRSQNQLVDEMLGRVIAEVRSGNLAASNTRNLATLNEQTEPQEMWVLDLSDLLLLAIESLLAPLFFLLKSGVFRGT